MKSPFPRPEIRAVRLCPKIAIPRAPFVERRAAPREISRTARRQAARHGALAEFSILRFGALAGSAAVVLSLLALIGLKLGGVGGFADGRRFSIGLLCLFAGLGFSSWLFEGREIRR